MRLPSLLLVALLLAGCSGSPSTPTPAPTAEPSAEATPSSEPPTSASAPTLGAVHLARESDGTSSLVVNFTGDGAYTWRVDADGAPDGEATTSAGDTAARIALTRPVTDAATSWTGTLSAVASGGTRPLLSQEISLHGATQILQVRELTWGNRGLIAMTIDTRHTGEIPHVAAKLHVEIGSRSNDWSIEASNRTFDAGDASRRMVGFALPVLPVTTNITLALRSAANEEIASVAAQLPAPSIVLSGVGPEIQCDPDGNCAVPRVDLNVTSLSATPTYVSHWYVTWNGTTQDVAMAPLGFYNSRHPQQETLALGSGMTAPRGTNEDLSVAGKDVNGAIVARYQGTMSV